MVRSYFYLKGMTLWNRLSEQYHTLCNRMYDIYDYSCSYFQNTHNTWIFLNGHSVPLPLSHIKNNTHSGVWKYTNHTLSYMDYSTHIDYKLSWLSVKLVIIEQQIDHEYDMDDFLVSFRVRTPLTKIPTLSLIFLAWCAENKLWFRSDSLVQFHVIDHNGKEHLLTLGSDNKSLEIRNKHLQLCEHVTNDSQYVHANPYTYYHG